MAADLKRHLENEPVTARPPSAAYKFQKAFRRNKLLFAAGTVKPAYVRWLVEEHESLRRNCSDQLYSLMVLEPWHRGLPIDRVDRTAITVTA